MHDNYFTFENCVCAVVRNIISVQRKLAYKQRPISSCEQSIKQLRYEAETERQFHTTIPFMLYNRDFKPFIASGVHQVPIVDYPDETYYTSIETPIFRANRLLDNSECCAEIELLRPVNANGIPIADQGEKIRHFFKHKTPFKTIHFRKTGIFIIVELNDFSGISCLDPIKPLDKY